MIYLFDLGGVIFHLDYNKTYQEFKKLTGLSENELFHQLKQPTLFDAFEKGEINEHDFLNSFKCIYLKNKLPNYSDSEIHTLIINAWNSMLVGIPEENILFLEKLSRNNCLYLLSNTNTLHWKEVLQLLKNKNQFHTFNSIFKKQVLSFEIGLRKPEVKIYEHCQSIIGCKKEDIYFIDDNKENIFSAQNFGFKTMLYPSGNPLLNSVIN